MDNIGITILIFVVLSFAAFVIGYLSGMDEGKRIAESDPVGTIYVNLSDPDAEFFTCTVNEDFMKSVCGPDAKPTVTFVVVLD